MKHTFSEKKKQQQQQQQQQQNKEYKITIIHISTVSFHCYHFCITFLRLFKIFALVKLRYKKKKQIYVPYVSKIPE